MQARTRREVSILTGCLSTPELADSRQSGLSLTGVTQSVTL